MNNKLVDKINIGMLAFSNAPIVYNWYIGDEKQNTLLMYFGIIACLALDVTTILQATKKDKNIFTWLSVIASSVFSALVALSIFGFDGYLHAAFAVLLLFVSLSNSIEVTKVYREESVKPTIHLSKTEQQLKDILIEHNGTITRDKLKNTYGYNANSIRVYVKGLKDKGIISTDENGIITLL